MSSYFDTMIGWFLIVAFAIGAVLAVLFVNQIGAMLQTSFSSEPAVANMVGDYTDTIPSLFSWFFIILVVTLPLLAFGLAVLVPTNPIWYWLYMAVTLPLMLFAVFFRDLWVTFSSETLIANTLTDLAPLKFVMDHFMVYAALYFVLIGIGTYVKIRGLEVFR